MPATAAPVDFVTWFRSVAPYINAFRGKTFVIAFGGEVVADGKFVELTHDFNLLAALGIRLVLVHGARPQIEQHLAHNNLGDTYHHGIRLTDAETMRCVKEAVGRVRVEIEALLSMGLANSPMANADIRVAGGNFITAQPIGIVNGVDLMHTGSVRKVDVAALNDRMEFGEVVLLSPLGYSPTGEIFNLRAEDVATAVAAALAADKLVFLVPTDPAKWPLADDTGDAGQMSMTEAETLLREKDSALTAEDRGCLTSVTTAGRGGVKRIHLTYMGHDGALLRELYTRDGSGLLFYSDEDYESIREAVIDDVGGILSLIQPLEESGALVPRSREQLELEIGNFSVMVRDGLVIACAALFPFPESQAGELACVAVHPEYRGHGRAAALFKRIELQSKKLGLKRMFSLTTHTPHWFIERGFAQGKIEDLPGQKQRFYNYQRNSLVLVKNL